APGGRHARTHDRCGSGPRPWHVRCEALLLMNQLARPIAAVLVGLATACSASTQEPPARSLGATEMQPTGSCLGANLQCTEDTDCCSGTCAGQVCTHPR